MWFVQDNTAFKSSNTRAEEQLELVYSDVVQMDVLSNGGKKYFITFLDDYSQKLWVYPMKNKGESLDKIKQFKAAAEGESYHRIGSLRTDNGGEYIGKLFKQYLSQKNIRHQTTRRCPTTQKKLEQLNGPFAQF